MGHIVRGLALLSMLSGATSVCILGTEPRSMQDSRECISCHDGSSVAPCRHPVGLSYPSAWESPARGVVLVGGRVECTSCHDGSSTEPGRVAVTMAGSRLCGSCHRR